MKTGSTGGVAALPRTAHKGHPKREFHDCKDIFTVTTVTQAPAVRQMKEICHKKQAF
jgi:hypothetical protein